MKVTVKNPSKKPINISKLAPLMPVQVLGVNQEISVNVRDIEGVMKRAEEIGVTVTPMEAFDITPVVEEPTTITETPDGLDGVSDGVETHTETNEVTPEMVETDGVIESIDETKIIDKKPKKKTVRKSVKAKKTTTKKSIFGNNK